MLNNFGAKELRFQADIYLLKFNNRNSRIRCETCLNLTIKAPLTSRRTYFTPCSSAPIVIFEHAIVGWVNVFPIVNM